MVPVPLMRASAHGEGALSDTALLVTAAAVVVVAWGAPALPFVVPIVLAAPTLVLAYVRRWRPGVSIGIVLLAASLSAAAWHAVAPTTRGRGDGWYLVRTDPSSTPGLVRFDGVEESGDGRRLDIWVSGGGRSTANELQGGDRVQLRGLVVPRQHDDLWLARRHVVGRLEADWVGDVRFSSGLDRLVNRFRRLVGVGATSLAPDQRALLGGFVLGDDRDQTAELTDRFRASGLSHLLVVSGQNVAFVLLLCAPVLRRCRPHRRVIATFLLLWVVALTTRFEPSVLRATVMAALAVGAWGWGRSVSGRRVLALAVIVLVIADPLIAGSGGFLLSVAASGGILLLSAPIAARVPGPRPLAEALSVTLAAQLAVTPLLAARTGGFSLVAIPANLLVAPTAGPIMAWGIVVGPLAGWCQEAGWSVVARWLHHPTRIGLWWVDLVAEWGAAVTWAAIPLLAMVVMGSVVVVGVRNNRRWLVVAGLIVIVVTGTRPAAAPSDGSGVSGTLAWWGGTDLDGEALAVVVVDGRTTDDDVLRAVRSVPLTRVLLIQSSAADGAGRAAALVHDRVEVVAHLYPGTGTWSPSIQRGTVHVEIRAVGERLVPAVGVASARAPPGS